MKTRFILLLSLFLITAHASATTLVTPAAGLSTADGDSLYCQITNIGTTNAASATKPITLVMVDDSGANVEFDTITYLAPGQTAFGTRVTYGVAEYGACVISFTATSPTHVRAGLAHYDNNISPTYYLKAE